jgi:hypothetical protein
VAFLVAEAGFLDIAKLDSKLMDLFEQQGKEFSNEFHGRLNAVFVCKDSYRQAFPMKYGSRMKLVEWVLCMNTQKDGTLVSFS